MSEDHRKAPRSRILPLVVAVCVVAIVGAIALTRDATPDVKAVGSNRNASTKTAAQPALADEIPAGMEGVAGPDGGLVGYVRTADTDQIMSEGPSSFSLGSGAHEVQAQEVVDAHGDAVGYLVNGVGFLTLVQAADDDYVDSRLAEFEALQAANADKLESVREDPNQPVDVDP